MAALKKDHAEIFSVDGVEFIATISPCSWMYGGHLLQVEIDGGEVGRKFSHLRKPFTECDVDDFRSLLRVDLAECKVEGCTNKAIVDESSNRDGMCESCFVKKWKADLAEIQRREREEIERNDAEMRAQGFKWKTVAWVHPKRGGDDYQIDIYFKGDAKPRASEIKPHIRKAGSSILDDYSTVKL